MKIRFNKIISVLLVLIMLVSAVPFSVYANENATKLMGDVNLDKHINSSDVLLILEYSANASDELICDFNQADINGDLEINSIDAFYVLEYATGLIDDLSNIEPELVSTDNEAKIDIVKVFDDDEKIVLNLSVSDGYINAVDMKLLMFGLECETIKGLNRVLVFGNPGLENLSYCCAVSMEPVTGDFAQITLKKTNLHSNSFSVVITSCVFNKDIICDEYGNIVSVGEAAIFDPLVKGNFTYVVPTELNVTQLNKDGNTITAAINLTSGTFNSIDLDFEMNGLVCKSIQQGDFSENTGVLFASNPSASALNNIAIASFDGVTPGNLAVVTLEVIDDSYSFNVKVTDCEAVGDENVKVEPIITSSVSGFEHRYTSVVTDPTCEDEGYTTYTCPCGDSYVDDYVDETGHTPGEWVVTVPATSLTDGTKVLKCSVCTAVLDTQSISRFGSVNGVSIDNLSMQYKTSSTFAPVIVADNGVEYSVTYSSSDPSVASVDENGNVYAAGKGTAEITCTVTDEYGNVAYDTATVEVKYVWWQWIIIILLFGWIWY